MDTVQVTPGKMLVSVVEEVDEISEEDAKHIQMFFGCAKCKQSFSDAKEVLQHVRRGQCPGNKSKLKAQQTQSSGRKRGRPKRTTSTGVEASPVKKAKKVEKEENDFVTPPPVNFLNERRATRVSTGVIKRKSILDIIGEASARKDAKHIDPPRSVLSSDESETPVRRGPGRPKKNAVVEPSVIVTVTQQGLETEPLEGTVAPLGEESTDMEQLADTDESYIAVAEGSNALEGNEIDASQEAGVAEEVAEAVAEEVTENEQLSPSQNIFQEATEPAIDEPESSEQNIGEKARILFVDEAESQRQLMEEIGDGDNDEADYFPEEGLEDYAAEEDEEYEEEMEMEEQEMVSEDQEIILGDQVAHARVTQMGETKVIEIFSTSFAEKQKPALARKHSMVEKVNVVKTEKPSYDEPEEDIELKLEDLQDEDYVASSRKKSRIKTKKDNYSGYPQSKYVPKRPLRCPKCPQRFFMTREELDVHISCHVENPTEEVNYRCPDCQYQSRLWNRCLDHLITHPRYKEKFKDHDFVRNILGQYECPVCKKKFDRKNNMKGHVFKVHQKPSKTCGVCQQVFEAMDEKTFRRHTERCKGVDYSCPHCKYRTVISENYRKHLKIHNGTGFTCPVCSKVFPTKSRFRCHMNTHDQNRAKTVCEICGQEFMTEDAAKKHIVRAHAEVSEIYQCFKCSFTAKMESDLKKHINSVHFKKFMCDLCDYSTNSESAMEQHKQYHAPGRRFTCGWNNCFYAGPTPKHLTNHICQVHQPMSKHQCPVCMKCYKKKTHLARHLVIHTGEKPYVCLDCNEAFASHSTYYRHRARTGHDAKREGIVSVPQNIHIQYVTQEPDAQAEEGEGLTQEEKLISVEGIETTIEQGEDILTGEELEGEQVTYLLHIDENGQQVMVPATEEDLAAIRKSQEDGELEGHVHEIVEGNDLLQEGHTLLQQFEAGAFHPGQENVIIQSQSENIQQVQEEIVPEHLKDMQVEMMEEDVAAPGTEDDLADPQTAQVIVQETVMLDADGGEQQFIYQDADGSMHTVVEVEHPSDNSQQQYAILVLPEGESGAEPEAALSMLQLQSSVQQ